MLARLKSWRSVEGYENGQLISHEYFLKFRPVGLVGKDVKDSGRLVRVVLSPEEVPDELEIGTLYEIHEEFYMRQTRRFTGISPVGPIVK